MTDTASCGLELFFFFAMVEDTRAGWAEDLDVAASSGLAAEIQYEDVDKLLGSDPRLVTPNRLAASVGK